MYRLTFVVLVFCFLLPRWAVAQCCSNGINLLASYNPDFSIPGNPVPPGFNNDNTYSEFLGAGLYSVIISRDYGACGFTPQFDHTQGDATGRYLWFDTGGGASIATPAIAWRPFDPTRPPGQENSIDVQPNTTYVFSCWIRDLAREVDCLSGGAPIMGLRINGVDLAQIDLQDYTSPCCPEWIYLCTEWNSGNSTEAFIQIESRTDQGYTDLGIDDVFFGSTFENQQGILGNDIEANCTDTSVVLRVPENNNGVLWSNGSAADSLVVTTSGIYWVELTQAGCSGRDSVEVSFFTGSLDIDLGPDTTTCVSPPITLQFATSVSGSTLWSTGATTNQITVNEAGVYWAQYTSNCGVARDTVVVALREAANASLGNDVVACAGQSVALFVEPTDAEIAWSNGQQTDTIFVTSSGVYHVTLNNGCISRDTVSVVFNQTPQLNLPDSLGLCPNTPATLNAGGGAFNYVWTTGDTDSLAVLTSPGLVGVRKFNACGEVSDSTVVFNYGIVPLPDLPDSLLCLDETLTVRLPFIPEGVVWSDGSTEFERSFTRTGIYTVSSNQVCGLQQETIVVQFKSCYCGLFIPNAFTPDQDGLNDAFLPISECDFTSYDLRIFNRWGEEYFSSTNPQEAWTGGKQAYFAPTDVYNYQLTYSLEGDEPQTAVGWVILLR